MANCVLTACLIHKHNTIPVTSGITVEHLISHLSHGRYAITHKLNQFCRCISLHYSTW